MMIELAEIVGNMVGELVAAGADPAELAPSWWERNIFPISYSCRIQKIYMNRIIFPKLKKLIEERSAT